MPIVATFFESGEKAGDGNGKSVKINERKGKSTEKSKNLPVFFYSQFCRENGEKS